MNQDRLFDRFPEILFASQRKRMLLGVVAARSVEAILEPLLADFWEIMLLLPPDAQTDFENILRIYSDVAARYSLRIKPPMDVALRALTEYLRKKQRAGAANGARPLSSLAAEGQESSAGDDRSFGLAAESRDDLNSDAKSLGPAGDEAKSSIPGGASGLAAEGQMGYVPGGRIALEGQGFFKTATGIGVYIEFSFLEGEGIFLFGRRPVKTGVDIYLKDSLLLSMPAGEPDKRVAVGDFLEAMGEVSLAETPSEDLVRVEEKRG
ncbi:MAG: hypothetical protein ABFD97_18570 [Syntrophobacter sp.]